MNIVLLFGLELALSLGVSIGIILLLKPYLHEVLLESCNTEKRAAFWLMFTQLLMLIAPLLLVIFFSHIDRSENIDVVLMFKDALFRTLLGEFVGLALIGKVIWTSISQPQPAAVVDAKRPAV